MQHKYSTKTRLADHLTVKKNFRVVKSDVTSIHATVLRIVLGPAKTEIKQWPEQRLHFLYKIKNTPHATVYSALTFAINSSWKVKILKELCMKLTWNFQSQQVGNLGLKAFSGQGGLGWFLEQQNQISIQFPHLVINLVLLEIKQVIIEVKPAFPWSFF